MVEKKEEKEYLYLRILTYSKYCTYMHIYVYIELD